MDNRIFNVNGSGDESLLATLKLVFEQSGKNTTAVAWRVTRKHGMILFWYVEDNLKATIFPTKLTAEEVLPIVSKWLQSEEAGKVETSQWDDNREHDGHNSFGWRVYCEEWGHVADYSQAFVAIKPAYIWHGK